MDKIEFTIVGDYNDADTIRQTTIITAMDLEKFMPLIKQIREDASNPDHRDHLFSQLEDEKAETIEYYVSKGIDKKIVKEFCGMCPSEYDGDCPMHTLWEISWRPHVPTDSVLLFDKYKHYHWSAGRRVYASEKVEY